MRRTCIILGLLSLVWLCFAAIGIAQQAQPAPTQDQSVATQANGAAQSQGADETLSPESQDRLIREVRHELTHAAVLRRLR